MLAVVDDDRTSASATAPGREQENGGENKGRTTPHIVTAAGR